MNNASRIIAVASLGLLGGCVSQPQSLYHWNAYQDQVYAHFQGDNSSPQEQVAALEASLQEARAKDRPLPPGFHAHLGMLYAELGKADQVHQEFETEKALFPESAPYMDLLLNNAKK
ncbi:DUF4810 domain-containing protein [Pseudomonas sp. BMS12]|uniref:DUF4810 domain-containing protein n=1 Tax=Pseudomonas sp. BMS12 TaxID=1796033 RepID=UPI00083AADE1|nr:DUF4810 domain-containing protein [Pseudomonas sp. BMS12]